MVPLPLSLSPTLNLAIILLPEEVGHTAFFFKKKITSIDLNKIQQLRKNKTPKI